MCKKEDRNKIFTIIVSIYVTEEKHELVLKYCKEALENIKRTNLPKHFLEYQMGRTLMRLRKYREALQYFNNENLTYFKHTSNYSMGNDVGDINNDGMLDYISVDMAFEDHQRSKTNMSSMLS